jgi:DNA-directed RNA polymerase subunit K/omega
MITLPEDANSFEFARVASLRAAQLMMGCTARVERASKHTVTAQREVAEGKVVRIPLVEGSKDAIQQGNRTRK